MDTLSGSHCRGEKGNDGKVDSVDLDNTLITDVGLSKIKAALSKCGVSGP